MRTITVETDSPFFHWLETDDSVFFQQLDRDIKAFYKSIFFDSLEHDIEQENLEAERLAQSLSRRVNNAPQAQRVLVRYNRVKAIDLHRISEHIPEDFFGSMKERFDWVKKINDKKQCLLWHLKGLYVYLAFDVSPHQKWDIHRGKTYTKQRKWFKRLLKGHRENVEEKRKQEKLDKKRERVQKQKLKKAQQDEQNRHKYRTKWNGILWVDPEVKAGRYALLDDSTGRSEKVYVHNMGQVYARVSENAFSPTYGVTVSRLTRFVEEEIVWD